MNKFYFANYDVDMDMSYKKYKLNELHKSNYIKREPLEIQTIQPKKYLK